MARKSKLTALRACLVMLCLTGSQVALAETFRSDKGYTVECPEGWTAVHEAVNTNDLPDEVAHWLREMAVDLKGIDVMLLGPVDDNFRPNVNVVCTSAGSFSPTPQKAQEIAAELQRQFATMDLKADFLRTEVETLAGHKVVVIDATIKYPFEAPLVHQRYYYVQGDRLNYVLTCTDKAERFEQSRPTFEQIAGSFQAPRGMFAFLPPVMRDAARGGLIVGGVCGAVAGFLAVTRLRKKAVIAELIDERPPT